MWILLLLLFVSAAQAADVAPGAPFEDIDDFSGGLNTTVTKHKLEKNFSPNLRNVRIDKKPGTVTKRLGYLTVGSTGSLIDVRFQLAFPKESGDAEFIVSDGSVVLTTKDFQTYGFIRDQLNRTVNLSGVVARNKVWMTNGANSVFTWNGSSCVRLDGSLGNPNVPQFRFIAFWQERIWGLNTSANGSSLDFSAVASTDGVAIAPDDARAWPATNRLNVDQGDGTSGTGLFVKDGQLYVAKGKSIHAVFGTGESTYFTRKIVPDEGIISNDSISQQDGFAYAYGNEGILGIAGSDVARISDNMTPDMEAVLKGTVRTTINEWETQSDFGRGEFYNSTASVAGQVTLYQSTLTMTSISEDTFSGDQGESLAANGGNSGDIEINNTLLTHPSGAASDAWLARYNFYVKRIRGWLSTSCSGDVAMAMINQRTLAVSTKTVTVTSGNNQKITWDFTSPDGGGSQNSVFYEPQDVKNALDPNSNIAVRITNQSACSITVGAPYKFGNSFHGAETILRPATTGQFVSDVTTATTVDSWSTFDSERSLSGGSIIFYVRTATSAVNITTRTWTQIVPGASINSPAGERFVQWAASITAGTNSNLESIDNVSISHVEGQGSNTRPFSIAYKGNLYMAVSTESTGNYPLIYVKSRVTSKNPNSWVVDDSIPIRSFGIFNDVLYGGSSTSSFIYRLYYGTNDNGRAIDAYYETPNLGLGRPYFKKYLNEYLIDTEKETGATLKIGTSIDGGDFTEESISLEGSGRLLQSKLKQSTLGKFFRFRFRNNDLDKGMELTNFSLIYTPTATR